ncbi:MAG: hypothetical protein ACRDNZ_08965 [Streptosporangiaceae bacterium]
MPGGDVSSDAVRRDDGIRRVTRITWRAGAAGVLCSAVIAIAFAQHAGAGTVRSGTPAGTQGTIVVPGQPPTPAPGAGHVTSGAS